MSNYFASICIRFYYMYICVCAGLTGLTGLRSVHASLITPVVTQLWRLWPQVTSVQHAVRIKFDWLTAYINVMFPVAGLRWQWCGRMTALWRWRAAGLKLKRSDWTFPPSRWANTCRDTHYVTAATLQQQFVLQSQLKERDGEMNTHTSLSTLQGVAKQPKEIWNQNSDVKKINRM